MPWTHHRLVAVAVAAALTALASPAAAADPAVTLGVDVLLSERIELLAGKRVGLVTNQSGVDGRLVPTADRFARDGRFELVQLYAPEHGLRGALPAGKRIRDGVDPVTGVPVMSLFGRHKAPTAKSLEKVDVLVFDIQDIGSRTYTYTTTMGLTMRAAAKAKKPLLVLDRPNPQGGDVFEGPVVGKNLRSFVGWGPTPVTHGMTAGELARYYNDVKKIGADLTVVPMKGWRRTMRWEDTGLAFVPTSPGIPHERHAKLYVATGMVGGVAKNVNEGVGTTMPFELIGAEFVDPQRLHAELEAAGLPGVRFRPITYRPYYGRFKGDILHGVQIMPTDWKAFRPLKTALTVWTALFRLYGDKIRTRSTKYFAMIWGNREVLEQLKSGKTAAEIEASWTRELAWFAARRAPFLMYE